MVLLISLIALIIAGGAFVGCVKKTMHLQSQLDELRAYIAKVEKKQDLWFLNDVFKSGSPPLKKRVTTSSTTTETRK